MVSVAVRRATEADIPAMIELRVRSWRSAYAGLLPEVLIDAVAAARDERAARWRARMADASYPGTFLAVEVDGRLTGVAATGPSRDADATTNTGEVYSIYLDPDVIGQGVGRVLFAAAVDDLASRGFRTGTLWVLTDNERARRFYEAAGWRPDGATKRDVRADGTLDETRYRVEIGTPGT